MTRPGIEPESTASVADDLSNRPLIGLSTSNLSSAWHQIKQTTSDRKYTAFEANGKFFEFTRIQFGVKNGVAEIQRKMCEFIKKENLMVHFHSLTIIQ